MTPRIRSTAQARAIRAGILVARDHMARPLEHDTRVDGLRGVDVASELFDRAYLRTKLPIGARQRERAQIASLDLDRPAS